MLQKYLNINKPTYRKDNNISKVEIKKGMSKYGTDQTNTAHVCKHCTAFRCKELTQKKYYCQNIFLNMPLVMT